MRGPSCSSGILPKNAASRTNAQSEPQPAIYNNAMERRPHGDVVRQIPLGVAELPSVGQFLSMTSDELGRLLKRARDARAVNADIIRFLIHSFERPGPNIQRASKTPCMEWIDVECIDCGSSWIAQPGMGPGTYSCIGHGEALDVRCRHCGTMGYVPLPR